MQNVLVGSLKSYQVAWGLETPYVCGSQILKRPKDLDATASSGSEFQTLMEEREPIAVHVYSWFTVDIAVGT